MSVLKMCLLSPAYMVHLGHDDVANYRPAGSRVSRWRSTPLGRIESSHVPRARLRYAATAIMLGLKGRY
jgi:hypothetical protein